MAIVKAVGGGKYLRGVIRYITRQDKTRKELISGWNVDPENALAEMMATKRQWHKADGRSYKHFVQSFHTGDGITPEEAHAIAAELVERSPLWRDYEVLYATHVDRDSVHTHIVVNSVNIQNGEKFRYAKPALEELKQLSDEIVQAHGYQLEHERAETTAVTAWDQDLYHVLSEAHVGKQQSWMYNTALVVQSAMQSAYDQAAFIRAMEKQGYAVRWGKKSITYTTPDGNKVRAGRLEDIFKLPSVRERYADRETEQEQLRQDLKSVRELAQSGNTRPAHGTTIHLAVFNLDLTRSLSWVPNGSREDMLYETACDLCRLLRCSPSPDDFLIAMELSGYTMEYDSASCSYIIHHPLHPDISTTEISTEYRLPSIADALNYLAQCRYVSNWQDGRIYARQSMFRDDADSSRQSVRDSTADNESEAYAPPEESANNRESESSVQIDIYKNPQASISDDDLRAAALIYGQAKLRPETMHEYLAKHGYAIRIKNQQDYLCTPKGYWIEFVSPQEDAESEELRKISSIEVTSGGHMCDRMKPQSTMDKTSIMKLVAESVLGASSPEEELARLIGAGIHVQRLEHDGKTDYELISDSERLVLSDILRSIGITVKFPNQIPINDSRDRFMEQSQETAALPAESIVRRDHLTDLLHAVQQASAATDRETFVDLLKEQGCETRWTKNGTLTFIMPDGERIRASRLEKRFNLPPIAAAYGSERQVPTKGPRYDASQAIQKAMDRTEDRQGFNAALESAGYAITWKSDGSDATIIAPGGQHMRLSSLNKTFGLSGRNREEERNGIQSAAAAGRKPRSGELKQFRRAIDTARSSVASGTTDEENTRSGKTTKDAGGRKQASQRASGQSREDIRSESADTTKRAGRSQRSRRWDDLER